MKNDEIPTKTPEFTSNLSQTSTEKGIYRLLQAGEILQPRDAVYCPASDQWWSLSVLDKGSLIGAIYDPQQMGPVRRFAYS